MELLSLFSTVLHLLIMRIAASQKIFLVGAENLRNFENLDAAWAVMKF
jgi:hypothetical protein